MIFFRSTAAQAAHRARCWPTIAWVAPISDPAKRGPGVGVAQKSA